MLEFDEFFSNRFDRVPLYQLLFCCRSGSDLVLEGQLQEELSPPGEAAEMKEDESDKNRLECLLEILLISTSSAI